MPHSQLKTVTPLCRQKRQVYAFRQSYWEPREAAACSCLDADMWICPACSQIASVLSHLLCAAAGSANYPFEETLVHLPDLVKRCKQHTLDTQSQNISSKQPETPLQTDRHDTSNSCSHEATSITTGDASDGQNVVVVCRRGNDSQHIVQSLRQHGIQSAVDLIGGLSAWSQHADQSFPNY